MQGKIPLDICLDLIDAVAADPDLRMSTLPACALTCSAWLERARFHLYHSVSFEEYRPLSKFSDTIAASPELGALVRHLEISFRDITLNTDGGDETGPLNPRTIQHLPSLHSVALCSLDGSISTATGPLVRRLSRATSITHLELRDIGYCDYQYLDRFLEQFPHITSLSLLRVICCEEIGSPGSGTSVCRNLTSLKLELVCIYHPFLQILPSSIQFLELGPFYADDPGLFEDHFEAFPRYTSLQSLKLTTCIEKETDADWFIPALSYTRNAKIRELFLEYRGPEETDQPSIKRTHWQEMDDAISEGPVHLHLRRMSVKVGPRFVPDATEGSIPGEGNREEQLVALFKKCTQRGISVIPDFSAPSW